MKKFILLLIALITTPIISFSQDNNDEEMITWQEAADDVCLSWFDCKRGSICDCEEEGDYLDFQVDLLCECKMFLIKKDIQSSYFIIKLHC